MTGRRPAVASVEIDGLLDAPLPAIVEELFGRLIISVSSEAKRRTYTCVRSFVGPSRLSALLANATTGLFPEAVIDGLKEPPFAIAPSLPSARSTSCVAPVTRSRT